MLAGSEKFTTAQSARRLASALFATMIEAEVYAKRMVFSLMALQLLAVMYDERNAAGAFDRDLKEKNKLEVTKRKILQSGEEVLRARRSRRAMHDAMQYNFSTGIHTHDLTPAQEQALQSYSQRGRKAKAAMAGRGLQDVPELSSSSSSSTRLRGVERIERALKRADEGPHLHESESERRAGGAG